MGSAKLNPLEELVKLEADQLRQSLELISHITNAMSIDKREEESDDLKSFELKWIGIEDKEN